MVIVFINLSLTISGCGVKGDPLPFTEAASR